MTRRLSLAIAILAVATLVFVPGAVSAQSPPPTVAGIVLVPTTVASAASGVEGTNLARTGSDVIPMTIASVALLLVGSVLVVGARRRRSGNATIGLA